MIDFEVQDMTCGHCVRAITEALAQADKDALVRIDLAAHRVQVEPARAGAVELAAAIREAGYTPVPVSAPAMGAAAAASAAPRRQGGCCGGGCR